MMDSEEFEEDIHPNDVSADSTWFTHDGEEINLADMIFETPRGEEVGVVAITNKSDKFPVCVFCQEEEETSIIILLENNEYIYMSQCCGRVAFCEDNGEDNE
jgi:hypothetical protein